VWNARSSTFPAFLLFVPFRGNSAIRRVPFGSCQNRVSSESDAIQKLTVCVALTLPDTSRAVAQSEFDPSWTGTRLTENAPLFVATRALL
jgi:hypothetical protein